MNEEQKNPHYVTPEEARQMDCCVDPEERYCVAGLCMAWRWATEYYDKEIETPQGVMPSTTKRYSTTHGSCGMVRE